MKTTWHLHTQLQGSQPTAAFQHVQRNRGLGHVPLKHRSKLQLRTSERHVPLPAGVRLGVATSAAAAAGTSPTVESTHAAQNSGKSFQWEQNWWPAIPLSYLDPTRPTPVEILGHPLVVWRDTQGQWTCFNDQCPHRLAPLSEGRVENGQLMCSYHGWCFDGKGKCTSIPQAPDQRALSAAINSPRSCATVYPTQAAGGLLWVWLDPATAAQAAATPPPIAKAAEDPAVQPQLNSPKWVMRDMPYDYDVLLENLVDPSHLPFAHHLMFPGISRYNAKPMPFQTIQVDETSQDYVPGTTPAAAYGYGALGISGELARVCFHPPSLVTYLQPRPKGPGQVTLLYAVPTTPGHCRLHILGLQPPAPQGERRPLLARLMPPPPDWVGHITYQRFLDGDTSFLHTQGRYLRSRESAVMDKNPSMAWSDAYFMPISCDKAVVAMRKWMSVVGGGGPAFAAGSPPATKLSKSDILDRYNQHIKHCPECQKGMKWVAAASNATKVVVALDLIAFLAAATEKGFVKLVTGSPVATAVVLLVAATAFLVAKKCDQYLQLFRYVEFTHADNH